MVYLHYQNHHCQLTFLPGGASLGRAHWRWWLLDPSFGFPKNKNLWKSVKFSSYLHGFSPKIFHGFESMMILWAVSLMSSHLQSPTNEVVQFCLPYGLLSIHPWRWREHGLQVLRWMLGKLETPWLGRRFWGNNDWPIKTSRCGKKSVKNEKDRWFSNLWSQNGALNV